MKTLIKPCKDKLNPKDVKRNIIIIDAANLIYRFASTFTGATLQYDKNTTFNSGIIYNVIKLLIKLYNKYPLAEIIMVFEGHKKNNPRYKVSASYKKRRVNRKSIDIINEMKLIRQLFNMMGGICVIPQKGEADDGIANIVSRLTRHNYKIRIISNDHDMSTLLKYKDVTILKKVSSIDDHMEKYTQKKFLYQYDFHPVLYSMYLALCGDSTDSISGIKRIGKIKATKIIHQVSNSLSKKDIESIITDMTLHEERLLKEIIDVALKLEGPLIKRIYLSDIEQKFYNDLAKQYNLTKLRDDWPVLITVNKQPPNHKRILKLFELMKFKVIIRSFHNVIKLCDLLEKHKHTVANILAEKGGT